VLLVVVATNRWAVPSDEHAYWLASQRLLHGEPLYDPSASIVTPYAYWYPPVLAQVLAPVAAILPSDAFSVAWTVSSSSASGSSAGGRCSGGLALIAFLPVAVELWFRNIHLVLAVMVVLGPAPLAGAVRGRRVDQARPGARDRLPRRSRPVAGRRAGDGGRHRDPRGELRAGSRTRGASSSRSSRPAAWVRRTGSSRSRTSSGP
jgi:hypothetical protein